METRGLSSQGDDGMDIQGRIYREGRQWKVILELPKWVFEDIVADSDAANTPAIIGRIRQPVGYSGYQLYAPEYFVGLCRVEYIDPKEKDDETDEPPAPRSNSGYFGKG